MKELSALLKGRYLRKEAVDERHDECVRDPFEPCIFRAAFLPHELMKLWESGRVFEGRPIFCAQPVKGRQISGALVKPVLRLADLAESVFGRCTPKNIF
jgi:hypothetical protein